jgi:hypothetical protein
MSGTAVARLPTFIPRPFAPSAFNGPRLRDGLVAHPPEHDGLAGPRLQEGFAGHLPWPDGLAGPRLRQGQIDRLVE